MKMRDEGGIKMRGIKMRMRMKRRGKKSKMMKIMEIKL